MFNNDEAAMMKKKLNLHAVTQSLGFCKQWKANETHKYSDLYIYVCTWDFWLICSNT